ncbi:Fis family transcriptional regulator [Thermotomaculum hydrothermale]|uniref:Fis family transcriptional regulator n=1 Tax=Thermotomaculum hydrothermale TaxID=981385 RepID=A0A7R6Q008_9BACT|nr:helix-turn-helix domain-containing protein [Thermotomaculum hydrothermale]BBB33013.1 Fis family transcriptional regulator [Thermotomaculum hydrothermale]
MRKQLEKIFEEMLDNGIGLQDFSNLIERIYIEKALEKNNFNIVQTAKKLKIHRNTLSNKIKKLEIKINGK